MKYPFSTPIKVAFISENPTHQFTDEDRTQRHARTDFAWQVALNATNYNVRQIDEIGYSHFQNFDIVIYIPPKNNPNLAVTRNIKEYFPNVKVGIQQEGPHDYYKEYDIQTQIFYISMLCDADFILCHNEIDVTYYQAFNDNVSIMSTLMIEDNIKDLERNPDAKDIMLGGGFSPWYGGTDSYIVAQRILNIEEVEAKLIMPQMGRNNGEESFLGINVLPHSDWFTWMQNLSNCKYAIHMMPTLAAGTFSLNAAYLGIPCIGLQELDTQRLCHKYTTATSLVHATRIAKMLTQENYYKMASEDCRRKYEFIYNEIVWLNSMYRIFTDILDK